MEFKERLVELRHERNMTQKMLGDLLCISKMAVYHWEKGDSEPGISQLKILSEIFDVSIDYLVGKTDIF